MPEILRLLHKHYGGIDRFSDFSLMSKCILHAAHKEAEIPKLINDLLLNWKGEITEIPKTNKNMRGAKEIMEDYGIGGD